MLGLMLGAAFAFAAENLDTRIRRREDMEHALQVPSLGIVPRLPVESGRFGTGFARVRGLMTASGGSNGKTNVGTRDPAAELITLTDTGSPQAEAYRSIRTNLLFSDAVRGLKTIVITSPTPGEGKSTTAANLAAAYAQQGLKVLLVDCDLRKARIHQIFGLSKHPGLTDLILGRAPWEEVVRDVSLEGLRILTSGNPPPNPSELLGGARMRKALELFRSPFDIVILDTPPLIAGPDAAILGSACDGVVLVVRAGQTEREAAQQAIRQLYTVGARVLGAVLNDPNGELPRYSSYYAYQYKYYGSDKG
jgi:capsular exopolysaccharide synthesis family protein